MSKNFEKEYIALAFTACKMENPTASKITKNTLENELKQQFGNNKEFIIKENGDGSFIIEVENSERLYYAKDTGEIIDSDNTIKISTADEFKNFRDDVNNGNTYEGKYVCLTNDITLNTNENWQPIAQYSDTNPENNCQFKGVFDGKLYSIYGLHIDKENERYQGLFGNNSGTIQNVIISENSYIMGKGNTGAIVGYNTGKVLNCINNSPVYSNLNNTGGVVGKNEGYVFNCYNFGNVNCTANATGGVVGWNCDKGIIENCKNEADTIVGYTATGGISGSNDGKILKCYNCKPITSNGIPSEEYSIVGGISGSCKGDILNSYNTGAITSEYGDVGGICGYSSETSTIMNCYNIGQVTSSSHLTGGIGGYLGGSISHCYYLTGTSDKAYYRVVSNETVLKLEQSFMTSNDFLNILNTNETNYKITSNLNNSYPILTWQ